MARKSYKPSEKDTIISDKEKAAREELRKAWAIWWTATDKDMDQNLAVWRGLYCK